MLSNKGSVKLSFLITFLIIFLICGIYCFIAVQNGTLSRLISSNLGTKQVEETNYEVELKEATRRYVNYYYDDLKDGERLIIKLSTLRKYDYITMNDCNGYSFVNKNGGLNIDSYVNCRNYQSDNYEEEYE